MSRERKENFRFVSEAVGIDSRLLSHNGEASLALQAGRMFTTGDSQKLLERVVISGSDTFYNP